MLAGARKKHAGEKFAVLVIVKPGAFDVKEFESRDAPREGESVDGQLRNRTVGPCVRFVVEDVHSAIAHLQEVDVAGEDARGIQANLCDMGLLLP